MGRLNYSARRISGVKAAQVISKDLKKRIPPAINSKAAGRDPTLEIDVSNKNISDEGFAQFIDDLIQCIKYRDDDHLAGLARVVELHVSGNELTVQSLVKLGEVVALSKGDIQELDISNNNIEVKTPEEKQIWSEFLSSFKDCYMLKKFDLGGNPLGAAGMEILARVYIKSDLDFLEVDAEDMIGRAADEIEVLAKNITALKVKSDENEPPKSSGQKKSPNKGKSAKQSGASSSSATLPTEKVQAKLKHFACTRGLRSIPYLIVSDIPMTSGSAVHLASMLEVQRTPEQLLEFLPKGKTLTLPEEAQVCKGIIWQPCYNLADYACNLLSISERIHDLKDIPDPEEADDEADEDCDDTLGHSSSDQAVTRKMGTLEMRKMQSKKYVEFTRLNKRLRMEALKNEGVKSFEIWITALRMMLVSRALLLEDRDRTSDSPAEDDEEESDQPVEPEDPEESAPNPVKKIICDPSEDERVEQLRNLPHQPPMPMTSHGPFYPGTDEFFANFPALSPVPTIHVEKVAAEDENDDSEASNEVESPSTKDALSSATSPPHRSGKANTRILATREPEKSGWRYGLSLRLWRRIIADAVGANQVLDDEQQEQILRYASNWEAVRYEMTITGAEDHQQIWKFLETVHCFTYSRQ